MRTLQPEFSTRLGAEVTTLAHVWRITRRDGLVLCVSDHDDDLEFEGELCHPGMAWRAGAIAKAASLAVDTASAQGVLNAQVLTEAALAAGQWDGARVEQFLIDWTAPQLHTRIFTGAFGEVRRGAEGFEVELRGLQAPLNTPVGRVFSRNCDALLGDQRCGKGISAPPFLGAGVVIAPISASAFRASGLETFADGWFSKGLVQWQSGRVDEVSVHRATPDAAILELATAQAPTLQAGATFSVSAGCDKRAETCRGKFANIQNFRGFPHMPGNDLIQSGPENTGNDGTSRWR